ASARRPSDLSPGAASPQSKVNGAPADGTSVIRPAYVETPSASLELSATAQWLQKSLLTVGSRDAAASIRASQPLPPNAPRDTEPLAKAFSASIAQSGLFYESHLADWVVQRYPESLLRREPQARWGGDPDGAHDEAHPIRDLGDGAAVAAPSTADDGSRESV